MTIELPADVYDPLVAAAQRSGETPESLSLTKSNVSMDPRFVDTSGWACLVEPDQPFIDQATDDEAWQLIKSRQDKDWSLVDSASFVQLRIDAGLV